MPTLCVLMWYDAAVQEFGDVNYEINKLYCAQYGHTLIRSSERTCPNRAPQWERVPLMLKYLEHFDYVMWIDADAHFYLDAPDIMTSVIEAFPEKTFIFSADCVQEHDYHINSGVVIVKQCPRSTAFLNLWAYNDYFYENRTGYIVAGQFYLYQDQGALQYMYMCNVADVKANSVTLPYGVLQHFRHMEVFSSHPFIMHMAGCTYRDRVSESQKYLTSVQER